MFFAVHKRKLHFFIFPLQATYESLGNEHSRGKNKDSQNKINQIFVLYLIFFKKKIFD